MARHSLLRGRRVLKPESLEGGTMVSRFLLRLSSSLSLSPLASSSNFSTAATSTTDSNIGSSSSSSRKDKIRLHWLDLRGSGLSMMERLSLEEALLRHDPQQRSWILVGTHEPWPHKYLDTDPTKQISPLPSYITSTSRDPNPECLVVMGIGGKPDLLLNIPKIKEDQVLVCKRFSGGGTVVLDSSSLWTTVIGRNDDFSHVPAYPKDIMEWSARDVFGPTFDHLSEQVTTSSSGGNGQKTLVLDSKSCSATENLGKLYQVPRKSPSTATQEDTNVSSRSVGTATEVPKFSLRENDYVFGDLKMGGNAQSIIKGGWLHHTSFLWDYDPENMEYLKLPAKRPDYRGDRPHDEFLVKLEPYFGNKNAFFSSLLHACQQSFDVEKVTLPQAMKVIDENLGGMDKWWESNRTRIVDDF